ncbi:CU044_5270 family protein [Actinomadura sp. 6N118]|uniref:CU044_5270 family protein n=1 Tax=Actinomadura sp. 6N118 TaxID=3375151 RepID=UPI0037B8378B
MNDLQILHDSWDTPPPPNPEARAAARATLLQHAAAASKPGALVDSPADHARRFRRDRPVPARAVGRKRFHHGPLAAGRRSRLAVRFVAVGALAAAIAAGVSVVQTADDGRPVVPGVPPGGVANAAAEALERAAVAAETRPFTAPARDQWIYTEFRNIDPARGWKDHDGNPVRELIAERQWHSADGRNAAFMWKGKLIRTAERPADLDRIGKNRRPDTDWPPADYAGRAALPTDPAALLKLMLRHPSYTDRTKLPMGTRVDSVAPPGSAPLEASYEDVFRAFGSILRSAPLPPKLEAAIFRAMKMIPDVRLSRKTVAGRDALVVGLRRAGYVPNPGWVLDQLLLDPRTYRYLGELSNPVDGPKPDCDKVICNPDGTGVNVLLTRVAVVDKMGERPR